MVSDCKSIVRRMQMKLLAASIFALAVLASAATAYAGGDADDCHTLSDSVYGSWGCR